MVRRRKEPRPRRMCGTMACHMLLLEKHRCYRDEQRRLEGATARMRAEAMDLEKLEIAKVKTVVHVVHHTREQNLSDAQIESQIRVLNRDFRARNSDRKKTPAPWKGLVGDARIEFDLVRVTRTHTAKSSFGPDNGMKKTSTGGIPPHESRTHLNLWVCALAGGLMGYAQFPGGPKATDGVVIDYRAFGTRGTAKPPFHKGRTATHEIGHYFNLRHIWADTEDCRGSDYVGDTPNSAGPNYGAPRWPRVSCNNGPNGDMFMNFMDYVDDEAMYLFTTQQVVRMRTALDHARRGLL